MYKTICIGVEGQAFAIGAEASNDRQNHRARAGASDILSGTKITGWQQEVSGMKIHMTRKISFFRINYVIDEYGAYKGLGRCTLDLFFQRLKLIKNDCLVYELRQTNYLLQILSAIPILGLMFFVPFHLIYKGTAIGRTKRLSASSGYQIFINDDIYEVHLHNDNKCSVMKNETQICLITKKEEVWFEENEYEILAPLTCEEDELSKLFLICMFIDVTCFANHRRWAAHKKEKNIVWDDAFPERAEWVP